MNLYLDYAIENFGICEGASFPDQLRELFPGCPEIRDGVRYGNGQPGLGIDIDERVAARYPLKTTGANRSGSDLEHGPRRA